LNGLPEAWNAVSPYHSGLPRHVDNSAVIINDTLNGKDLGMGLSSVFRARGHHRRDAPPRAVVLPRRRVAGPDLQDR
jgi:hypothetical protein